jgi:hypothetical protein
VTRPHSENTTAPACRKLEPVLLDGLFFSEGATEQAVAKAVCATCPLIDACRDRAMTAEKGVPETFRFGVFGGTTPAERAALDTGRECVDCQTVCDSRSRSPRCSSCAIARRRAQQAGWERRKREAARWAAAA